MEKFKNWACFCGGGEDTSIDDGAAIDQGNLPDPDASVLT